MSEIRRILEPKGLAYLSVARGSYSYIGGAEWERIHDGFRVERRGDGFPVPGDRWALVFLK